MGLLRSKFLQAVAVLLVSYLTFRFGVRPPVPRSVLLLYMAIVVVSVLVYVSSDSDSWRAFLRPIRSTLVDESKRPLRLTLLVLFPILAGYYAFSMVSATIEAPPELRAIHPAPPASITFRGETIDIQGLENPLRKDQANLQKYMREGAEIYTKDCLHCHGDQLDGEGHYAHGFNPIPTDFTDLGTIAMLQESFLFWRIAKGGPGLPRESAPWSSAMPAWEDRLSTEEIWKVILYLYETTGFQPRRWEEAAAHPAPRTPSLTLPPPRGREGWRGSHPALFSDAWAQQWGGGQELGKQVYEKWCALCHGFGGKGDGVGAPFLDPRPRDFTRGLYKIRSTPTGTLPTDEDLLRIITEGMPGTSMPGWGKLPEAERRAVVQHIKGFSDHFKNEGAGKPIDVGKEVASSKENVEKGRQLYQDLECFTCHGEEGRGDGPSIPDLKDDWGDRIRPTNLTKRWTFRGGHSVKAIYARFNTGIAGTPMPAYSDSIDAAQSWQLSHYVASLGPESPNYGSVLAAQYRRGVLPTTPDDPAWGEVAPVNFPLVGQVIVDPRDFTPSIDMVSVKAVYNDAAIAFLLSWDDPTPHKPVLGQQTLPDAIAVQFPEKLVEGERPYFLMGDAGHPVYLIRWRSDPEQVEELTATGPGRIKTIPAAGEKEATGAVVYHEGQYRLLVRRPLASRSNGATEFQRARFIPMTFFAWDGSNGESGNKMSLSTWYYLYLEEPASAKRFAYPPLAAVLTVAVELLIVRRTQQRHVVRRR